MFLKYNIVAIITLLFVSGCKGEKYIASDPHIGKQFILQESCYVFERTGSSEAKYPLIGCNFSFAGRLSYLPEDVDQSNIGKMFGSAKIISIAPKGSVFSVVAARVYTHMTNQLLFYEIQFSESSQRIDAISILSMGKGKPLFDPKIALPK